jgi:hypothetical protein
MRESNQEAREDCDAAQKLHGSGLQFVAGLEDPPSEGEAGAEEKVIAAKESPIGTSDTSKKLHRNPEIRYRTG